MIWSANGLMRVTHVIVLSLVSGGCDKDAFSDKSLSPMESNGEPSDRNDTSVGEDSNPGDGDGEPSFTFERAAVLGEWPTTSRLIRSTCDAALGNPAEPASGTTEIAAINDQVVEIRRPNTWRAFGALDQAESTLEGTWSRPDGTPVKHKLHIEFESLKEFIATSTMTVERSAQVPEGCEAVVEDHALRP